MLPDFHFTRRFHPSASVHELPGKRHEPRPAGDGSPLGSDLDHAAGFPNRNLRIDS
jgi:hypothetical protein